MHLVPIPTTAEYLDATFNLWSPFLPDIARRAGWAIDDLLGKLHRHEVQPVLCFDGKEPFALIGVSIADDGGVRVGELVWLSGNRRWSLVFQAEQMTGLLIQLESYLRDHVKCKKCRAYNWRRFFERHGYEYTGVNPKDNHLIMEKVL